MQLTQRNRYLDVLKGTAIILVVLYHAVAWNDSNNATNYLLNFLMPILMPTFFGVAGYLLFASRIGSNKDWIIGKAKFLLPAHFGLNGLMYLASMGRVIAGAITINSYTFAQWIGRTTVLDEGEWFAWAFFFVMIFTLALKLVDQRFSRKVFWLYFVASLLVVGLAPGIPGLFHMVHVQWYYPFAASGYVLAKYWTVISRYHPERLAGAAALFYVPYLFITRWNGAFVSRASLDNFWWIAHGTPLEGPKVYLQSILGLCLITSFCFWINKFKGAQFIAVFGFYSFGMYIWQQVLLILMPAGGSSVRQFIDFYCVLFISLFASAFLSRISSVRRWFPTPTREILAFSWTKNKIKSEVK
jgi:hypothetical protein